MRKHLSKPGSKSILDVKMLAWPFIIGPMILLMFNFQHTDAILNCFTPNMFKMGKLGQPQGPYVGQAGYGAERANWYPQQAVYQQQYGAVQHPMKRLLFQPKWKTGGGLFGARGWMGGNSWKFGANSNFYRPGYNYGYPPTSAMAGYPSGYPLNDQLNISPFSIGNYPSAALSGIANDGWSSPLQTTYSASPSAAAYDSYSSQVNPAKQQVSAPVLDPYSTKGTSSGGKYQATTKNNILIADGGYNSYDAHLVAGPAALKNQTYGYSYPSWYSGPADSPARIAQQLMKYGGFGKQQRLQEQQQFNNRSAQLLLQNAVGSFGAGNNAAQFTILDEPRFVGYGTVDVLSNREARLSCSFREAIDQTNRPLWVKFLGPYNSSQVLNGKSVPPFNCANSQCRTQEVESTKDFRYKFDNGPATSTLIISEPRLADYGIYRCSALTKAINNNPLETIYQIVQFGVL